MIPAPDEVKPFVVSISRDTNGNKTLEVRPQVGRKFSIQTLGNLPTAHAARNGSLDWPSYENSERIKREVLAYVAMHGTERQKTVLGLCL